MPSSDDKNPISIVGVGCSVAGLNDFLDVLRGLGGKLPHAIALAVSESDNELKTEGKTVKQQIETRSPFPIVEVSEAVAPEAGRVYVAAKDLNLELADGRLIAHPSLGDDCRTRIDHLFTSIATQAKRGGIAVILSGNGSDGTLGLRDISESGGTTVVQLPQTASEPSMPESAESLGVVDYLLTPAEISHELLQLALRSVGGRDSEHTDLTEQIIASIPMIAAAIERHTDNDFKHYKTTTLVRRIRRRLSVLKIDNVDSYIELLQSSREEATKLFRELLISVTEFFRDPESFETLASTVLAKCIEERSEETGNADNPFRIWVAGCATGEEAYSLAILLLEQMKKVGKVIPVQVFATDLDDRALQVARVGAYPVGIVDQVSTERLKTYFHKRANQYFINKEVRQIVVFSSHNLISDSPFTKQDLILCRNLLIYLGTHLQRKLIPLFHYSLRPNGHLFLGPSESMSSHKELFTAIDVKHRIYQRKLTSISGASVRDIPSMSLERQANVNEELKTEVDMFQYGQRIMLDEFAPQWAIIDDDGRIQTLSSEPSEFLQLGGGTFENNIIKLAHGGLKLGLRAAFSEAKKHRRRVVSENLSIPVEGGLQKVNITVQPMPEAGSEASVHFVVFQKSGEPLHRDDVRDHAETGMSAISQAKAGSLIDHLESELAATRHDLERTVQELEAANEELKSSNEELLSMNEELQSANEELSTSKEELQASNETLARSNSDLENLFRSSNTATIFLDKSNCVRNFTPAMSAIYSLRESDVGRPLTELTCKAVAMSPLPTSEEFNDVHQPDNETIETNDGRWFIRRIFPYKTALDEADGIVVAFTEVTELRVGQQRLEMALKGGDLGAWDLDLVANESWRSARHDSIFGYEEPLESWGMDSFLKHVHEDDRGWIQEFLESTRDQQHWDYACRIRCPDGGVRWIETHATTLFDDSGQAVRMFGTVADITNRRKDEAKLAALAQQAIDSSAKARVFFDQSRYYAGVLTLDGVLTDVNQTATKMCGYDRADEIGKLFWETSWWHDLPEMQAEVKGAVAGAARGVDYAKNMNFRIADGSVRITEFVLSPIRDDDDQVIFILATGQDITDKVKFQDELQRMRQLADAANQAKSDFLANMSHEIRSPMTAILGFAELLNVDSAEEQQKVETIQRNGQFLLELINDILDLSKIEAGKIELDPITFSPAKLLEDVSSLMSVRAVDSGLDLSVEYSGELPTSLRSDPIRLRQVLINLTGNAIKFTDSGTVELRMSFDEQTSELRYTVTDTGIGMTPEQQEKLFRPFSQADSSILREYGGSGLGLAISQRLAELLGGRIEVTSELGRGSSFTLAIPCEMNTNAPPGEETVLADPVPLNSGQLDVRVLVVDDRRDIRFLSQYFVKQLGGEVITAENGLEAIEVVETEQSAGRRIDIVLMDVQMPKMDGFTAVRKLRADGFKQPIIALTANAMDSDRDACFEAGYTDYLSKPIDAKKLTEALRRHCGS